MDFKKTEEQELLLESLRTAYERGNLEDYFKECDKNHEYPQKAVDILVEAGFSSLGIPEEFGGTPTDIMTQIMVCEEAHALGYPSLVWINFATEVDDILTFGNEEQQKEILKYAMQGVKPFTLGFTEPQAGSDSAAMATTATKRDGKVYINGNKTFNTSADRAPYMLCVCRSGVNESPYKDFSMYLFPMDRPGITMEKLDKIGNNMCGTYEVHLDNVECEESDLVGVEGKGFYQLMKNFEWERCVLLAELLGEAQAAMEDAVTYANQRIAFNKPIANFQMTQEKLTEMEIRLQNTRNMLYKTLWELDNDISVQLDSALLKRYGCTECFNVADMALSIFGGIGYTTEVRVGRIWADCRGNLFGGGTPEIMAYIAGRQVAKKYRA
mgnify:CR=1 FL=1